MSWEVWTMKSRISFFDMTLLKKDITRFAPVWILYLLGGLLVTMGTVVSNGYSPSLRAESIAETIGPMAIVNLCYALVTASCLFGDLFNSRMCNAIYALPLRREQIFATHTIAGVAFSLVPNGLLTVLIAMNLGDLFAVALLWLLGMTLEYLFFFALAAVCAMSTGSRFAMAAVYAVLNFFAKILHWFVTTFYEPMLPGLHIRTDKFNWFCPTVWLSGAQELVELTPKEGTQDAGYYQVVYELEGLSDGWWYLAVLGVLAAVLLVLGILLIRERKLESAGDFLVFRPMDPVFSVIFTLTVAAVFRICGDLVEVPTAAMLVGFVVGCFGMEMLQRRTVKVFDKKSLIKCVAIGGAFGLTLVLTMVDPMGLTRWTPKPEKVEAVVLSDRYNYDPDSGRYGSRKAMDVTAPERIRELTEIHKELLETRKDYDRFGYDANIGSVHLGYQMSDGRLVERRYYYDRNSEVGQRIEKFYRAPEFIFGYDDWYTYLASVEMVQVSDGENMWEYQGMEAAVLMEMIKADCEEGHVQKPNGGYDQKPTYFVVVATETDWVDLFIDEKCIYTVGWIQKETKPKEL